MARRVDVELEVDYTSEDNFLLTDSASITNLSSLGMFIKTENPEDVGSELNLRFTPPDATDPLHVEGKVVWINKASGPGDRDAGMGVRFVNLDLEDRQRLVSLVRRIALLVDDDG
jgi:type IV pilus assembly protein PilZ